MRFAIKTGAGLAAFALVLAVVFTVFGFPGFSLSNPITTERVERDHPAILESLQDVSEFTAATGTYSVIIDHEDDVRFIPSSVAGERETMIAVGEVEATVDFARLGADAIAIDEVTGRVTVTLPTIAIGDVSIDHENTEVIDRDRGILNRVGGMFSDSPTSEKELLVGAEDRLAEAAAESELVAKGRTNTTEMLTGLLGQLGYDDVVIVFEPPLTAGAL